MSILATSRTIRLTSLLGRLVHRDITVHVTPEEYGHTLYCDFLGTFHNVPLTSRLPVTASEIDRPEGLLQTNIISWLHRYAPWAMDPEILAYEVRKASIEVEMAKVGRLTPPGGWLHA